MHVFLATHFEKKSLKKDPEEQIKTFWFPEKKIDNLIKNGELENGFSLAAWALYKLKAVSILNNRKMIPKHALATCF